MAGAWTMTEEGEFVLNEPYKSQLEEAKRIATHAWLLAMMTYLSEITEYSTEQLMAEFVRRSHFEGKALDIADSFAIEAMEGTLLEGSD